MQYIYAEVYSNLYTQNGEGVPPFIADVTQWLKGDTFEDNGVTYMRDYSGNDYHAIVVSEGVIVQQDFAEMKAADAAQEFWYTTTGDAIERPFGEFEYDWDDENNVYHTTFANIQYNQASGVKDIVTYNTARTIDQLDLVYNFINDQVVRDISGNPLTDSNNNIILIN